MKEEKKRTIRNRAMGVAKCILLFLILTVCTLPACILDLTYQGILTGKWCVYLLGRVKALLKFSGLIHADLWDFITSNIGVLITLVSMFFTFTIDIYERSEKKIFGISRKELEEQKHERVYQALHRMVTMCPLLILIYVIFGFCAGSYLLLFLSYIFLLIIYGRHRGSYDEEKMMKCLCDKILQLCKEKQAEDIQSFGEYQNLLIDIYDNTRKENDWIHVQKLFFEFLRRVRKLDDDICFAMEYYFVSIVFGHKMREFDFFTVIERYLDKIEHGDKFNDKGESDDVLLWGMLAASIPYAQEEELIKFLRNFSNFKKRSQQSIRHTKKGIPDSVIEKECAMMLVLLEGWLEFHDVKKKELVILIKRIYERGEKVFIEPEADVKKKTLEKGNTFDLYSLVLLYETIGDQSLDIGNILKRFLREKRLKVHISFVSNLIETI